MCVGRNRGRGGRWTYMDNVGVGGAVVVDAGSTTTTERIDAEAGVRGTGGGGLLGLGVL